MALLKISDFIANHMMYHMMTWFGKYIETNIWKLNQMVFESNKRWLINLMMISLSSNALGIWTYFFDEHALAVQ